MTSKAEKLKQKRGRRKVINVAREPNGRISRSGRAHTPADSVALKARASRMGVTMEEARDPRAATYIGTLNMLGKRDGLSDDQYEGAVRFLELRQSYMMAIKAPDGERDRSERSTPSQTISEDYEKWCKAVIARYDGCRKTVQTAQNELRQNLWAALDFCVIKGERQHHMLGDLRVVCNVLARFFGV